MPYLCKRNNLIKTTIMRKTTLFFAVAVICTMTACSGTSSQPQLTFDSISVDKKVALAADTNSPAYDMKVNVKYVKEASEEVSNSVNNAITAKIFNFHNTDIRTAVDSFVNERIGNYTTKIAKLYKADSRDIDKKPIYEYATEIKTRTEDGKKGVINYFIDMYNYEGGAHPLSQMLVLNFDKVTGKTLTLEDILVPGYKMRLNEILQKALMKKAACKDINELHDKGYLFSMEMYPSNNFILGKDAVVFVYNQYEIAPYALGRIDLTVDYETLKPLMKSEK